MTDRSEWHFQTWAGDTLVIYTTDDDPGDMGEPRTVEEDGVHYVAVRAALAQPAPAPDLLAAVEALPGSATFGEVWINRRAVLALLRAAPRREVDYSDLVGNGNVAALAPSREAEERG